NPKAYLYRAVASGCVDMLRRRTHTLPIDKGVGLQAEGPADEAEEEFRRINNLLKELPEQQSEVIRLHIYGQMKFTEIAEMMDISASTIKSRFSSGIERLRQLFIN
ncbi:MAG: RNA polymerase sigma factor, partial [Tidjanibacter sp.]|nr:RNA polymerase sigma factor [Tidjanibacter sp.]